MVVEPVFGIIGDCDLCQVCTWAASELVLCPSNCVNLLLPVLHLYLLLVILLGSSVGMLVISSPILIIAPSLNSGVNTSSLNVPVSA